MQTMPEIAMDCSLKAKNLRLIENFTDKKKSGIRRTFNLPFINLNLFYPRCFPQNFINSQIMDDS
jgi:hypothetical protein